VRLMGGEIGLESSPGNGSTFFFIVPLAPAGDERISTPADSSALVGKRVLVLDDNEINCLLLARLLPQWGLEPTVLSNATAALDEFRAAFDAGRPYPLVLLDQHMPDLTGYEVALAIRRFASHERSAILILSSGAEPGDPSLAEELGIARHLTKPLRR